MIESIDPVPFNLDKYVNYELEGYQFVNHVKFNEWARCSSLRQAGVRIWSKSVGNINNQIHELDIISDVDYWVKYYGDDGICRVSTMTLEHVGEISWRIVKSERDWKYHRDDGPAIIRINKVQKPWKTEWWVNGVDITKEVRPWIKSMGFPVFYKWTIDQKAAFKLAFR